MKSEQDQIDEAVSQLCKRLNARMFNGMTASQFCQTHEKWAKGPENSVTLSCGIQVKMDENFAYLFHLEKT